jgi:hypothetical protein
VTRLRQLDVRAEQDKRISAEWLPQNLHRLCKKHRPRGFRMLALWHQPKVREIAVARDAFDLVGKLERWRQSHRPWEVPYIVEMPDLGDAG